MFVGWSRHELAYHSDRITEVEPGDGQVYEASENLSEPRRVAYLSDIGTKLDGSVQRGRDGLTIGHPEFEDHTQHIMALADQYALGGTDQFDHVERCRKLELHTVYFT